MFVDFDAARELIRHVPKVRNLHQKVYAKAKEPGALDMSLYDTSRTIKCRAGWVVEVAKREVAKKPVLARKFRKVFEYALPSQIADAIAIKAHPEFTRAWDAYSPFEEESVALRELKRLATNEARANKRKRELADA